MSWWDTIANIVTRQRDVVVAPHMVEDNRSKKATLTDASWVTNPQFGSPRRIDFGELEEYETDITVQAAVNFIIDSVATSEWDIVPDEDIDAEDDTDTSDAIKFFNSEQWEESFEMVLRGMIADVLMYDCGVMVLTFPEFCYDEDKTMVKKGVPPLQLRARDGRSFIKQVTEHGDIIRYWQYSFLNQATKPVEFDKDEIIYVQERPSTRSPYGTSKLEVVKNVADLMIATQIGHRSEQENALQIGGVINHPDVTDTERLKAFSVMYNANLKGEHNKNAWLVTGGNVEVNPIDASISDNSWISGSEFYQQQILAVFKVPKTILGITSSDTNRATAVAQSTNFKRMGVSTMLSLIEKVLTREIVKKYFDPSLMFRFVREVDLTDEAIRADVDAKNVSTGVRTVNELRMRDGLDEIDDMGDTEETEETYVDEYGEFEGLDFNGGNIQTDEAAINDSEKSLTNHVDIEKKRIWVPPSGKRIGYYRDIASAQEQYTDVLMFGVERFVEKGEKKLQEIDVGLGIDPKIGESRRKEKRASREVLFQLAGRGAVSESVDYTSGMKALLERGDIEKKKSGKGYKITKVGKRRIKDIDAAVLEHIKNVPNTPDDINKFNIPDMHNH